MPIVGTANPTAEEQGALMSTLVAIGDMSLDERKRVRQTAEANAALQLVSRARMDHREITVRTPRPHTDLGIAGTGESWLIPGPSVVGTAITFVSQLLNAVQACVFFGLSLDGVPNGISQVTFQLGAGDIRAIMHVEELESRLEPEAYFGNQEIYGPNDTITLITLPKAVFASLVFPFQARWAEPLGQLITTRRPV